MSYYLVFKYLVTAFVIVVVSEVAKRSDRLGALILALPLMTVMTMIWLHLEHQAREKISVHAYYTFWYVVPTLPMFLLFPYWSGKGMGFWLNLGLCAAVTMLIFVGWAWFLKGWKIEL
jgi:hypothetical protein